MSLSTSLTVSWGTPSPPPPPPPMSTLTVLEPTGYSGIDFPGGNVAIFIYNIGSKASVPVTLFNGASPVVGASLGIFQSDNPTVPIAPNAVTNGSGAATFLVPQPGVGNTYSPNVVVYVVSTPTTSAIMPGHPAPGGRGGFAWT